jgi:hypothetical protein
MVRLTNGTARTHPFSEICWNLLEVDFTVWNWRRRWSWKNERLILDTPSPIAWDYEGYLGFHPPCNIFTEGCAIPVGTSMCSATILTSACVKDVHLCIYIYIYLYIIYVCNITWSTYQCDTPQPPVAYGSVPIRFSFINPHFPYVYRLCTRAHEEHQIGMPPQQLRLSGESASESLSKEVFV